MYDQLREGADRLWEEGVMSMVDAAGRELRRLRDVYFDSTEPDFYTFTGAIEEFERELAELGKDAARYRWLRKEGKAQEEALFFTEEDMDHFVDDALSWKGDMLEYLRNKMSEPPA